MHTRVLQINAFFGNIPDVKLIEPFEQNGFDIKGRISVFIDGLLESLVFGVVINPQYPFKRRDMETIKFFNADLLKHKHIMADGSVCIHTAHSPDLLKKLEYDIHSLKEWISRYYINGQSDTHYEHLIVTPKAVHGSHFAFLFNEVEYTFRKNQFGIFQYSKIADGAYFTEKISSNIVKGFYDTNGQSIAEVHWNFQLKALPSIEGIFIFLKDAPSDNDRWTFTNWQEFEKLMPQDFLEFLHLIEKSRSNGKLYPLLVGYGITDIEIHWQAIMLEIGKFPIEGAKVNQKWITKIRADQSIDWAMTRNCSYKYFFGRGRLHEKLTHAKVLIIGIGAIGSILAKTLVRCGCIHVDFLDYDLKEPENVCRSEYSFFSGITNKTNDLLTELCSISPFFEPKFGGIEFSHRYDEMLKSHVDSNEARTEIENYLNTYDVVFDCSADNDLLYVLSSLRLKANCLNLSISNHAKHLVCAVEQNRYDFVQTQFHGNVLKFDADDLHNPTGCWSPTFKASFNDISTLVQLAIKQINLKLSQDKPLRNFVIETDDSDALTIQIREF